MENMKFVKYLEAVEKIETVKYVGSVTNVKGILIQSLGPRTSVGEMCHVVAGSGERFSAEVIAIENKTVQLICYDSVKGIEIGDPVIASDDQSAIAVGREMLGRILDPLGRPLDGKPMFQSSQKNLLDASPPSPIDRKPISKRINTGIRAIDAIFPIGCGQRMGIFAGSGVGKSTLLGMVARNTSADINVIALIGERGREVREFIENDLGPEGLARSVLIVSTSDTSAISRVRGAFAATAIAEYFRDEGNDVMLLFDSITRLAMSQREIGLSRGEPPSSRSYTPSVFSMMPRLLERAGVAAKGTITALYTVLVEGDDLDEPVSDAVRGYLDGHMVLSRRLAQKNHYPAIDILESISRVAPRLMGPKTQKAVSHIKILESAYREKEDLINIGAYVKGSDAIVDESVEKRKSLNAFLTQSIDEKSKPEDTFNDLLTLAGIEKDSSEKTDDETISIFA